MFQMKEYEHHEPVNNVRSVTTVISILVKKKEKKVETEKECIFRVLWTLGRDKDQAMAHSSKEREHWTKSLFITLIFLFLSLSFSLFLPPPPLVLLTLSFSLSSSLDAIESKLNA